MATFASLSTPPFSCRRLLLHSLSLLKKKDFHWPSSSSTLPHRDRRSLLLLPPPLKCSSSDPTQNAESEPETTSSSVPSSSSSSSSSPPGDWAYKLCAGLGGIGLLETTYLTYLKLTNSTAFCPIGGGSCGDVLSSDYAVVFGVPLSLTGMVSYGLVAALGVQLTRKSLPFGLVESDGRQILLWSTTSMAAASAYFLYILTTKLSGTSCSYCLFSVLLSFSLFGITLKDFGWQNIQKEVGLQLCIASLVVVTLNSSYSAFGPVPPRNLDDINLPYFTTEITTKSSPYALALAKHLNSIGAKMYGAFWCSHCVEQKEKFGYEAAKLVNYVECFPNGFTKGTKMENECLLVGIEGFPTWVINGQKKSGELEFSELAELSGFKSDEVSSESMEFVQ